MSPGVVVAVTLGCGALFALGLALVSWAMRRRRRELGRQLADRGFLAGGGRAAAFADYTAMLHEVGAIDDWHFEALLAELRDAEGSLTGAYARQQLLDVHRRLADGPR